MGTKINAQLNAESEYTKSVHRLSTLIMQRARRIWLHPDFTFYLSRMGREFRRHLKIVQGFTQDVIRSRRKAMESQWGNEESQKIEEKKNLTFLNLLLKAAGEDGSIPLTEEELREEVDTFMFAGHDTTSAGISWTLFLLGHHPKIQQDVHEEVRDVFERKKKKKKKMANDPSWTISDLAEMKLLERVIKESLRICPSVVSIGKTLDEDVDFGQYTVPKGTTAIISILNLHMDENHYPNPEKFDPDRFLPEKIFERHPYSYLPFSAGPRNCIGQKFAMFEEKVILSNLLYRYKFESVEKFEEVKRIPDAILKAKSGIKLKVTKR